MFETLAGAIEELDVPAHADAIVELRALRDRLDARLTIAEAAYAKQHGYEPDGFGSMASFLRHRTRMATGEAGRASKRADRVAAWPEVGAAWRAGTLTGAQVDVVARTIPERHVERFAATAADTCTILSPLDLTDTKRALEHWVAFADSCAEREAAEDGLEPPAAEVEREVFLSRTSGDVAVLKGELDADAASVTEHALRLAERPDAEGERRSPARRRADALVAIAQFYADNHTTLVSNRRQERLVIDCPVLTLYGSALRGAGVRTADELEAFLAARPGLGSLERGLFLEAFDGSGDVARTLDGNPIGDGLLSCVSEGGVLSRLLTVGSRVIDHGRDLRAHSASQWRALATRDGGCRYPGCDDEVDGLHAHHVERWEEGGPTDLDHAVLLSPHCHTIVHQPGWSERLEPDGTYVVTTPKGEELRSPAPRSDQRPLLPVRTTARGAPAIPFDPTPARSPRPPTDDAPAALDRRSEVDRALDRILDLVAAAPGPVPNRTPTNRPCRADFVIDGWIVSLS